MTHAHHTAVIRATGTHRPSTRFFRSVSAQRANDLFEPLTLKELCKRCFLRELGLKKITSLDKVDLPRTIRLFLKNIPPEYFSKPDNFGWLHYLNHFTLRNIHVAECLLDRSIYTVKMVSSTFVLPSPTVEAWKAIRHVNVMQYVVSVREMPPWRIYHIFQGTSMSLRVCDELKTCRKLIIPENLLWNVIEKIVSGLAYIHHEKKLLYNNFTLDHVYYALDGTQLILENPLLHDFPNLSSQHPRMSAHFRSPPQIIIVENAGPSSSDTDSSTHEYSPDYFLKESERRAVHCLGKIMDRLSLPADASTVVFGSGAGNRREQTSAIQRAIREVHYSSRLITLIERMFSAREIESWPNFREIQTIANDARQVTEMAVTERCPMTILEYVRPEEGPVPLIRRYLSPWIETEEDEASF